MFIYNGDVSHIACGDVTHVVTCDDSDQYVSNMQSYFHFSKQKQVNSYAPSSQVLPELIPLLT